MEDKEIIKALERLISKAGHENHRCCRGCVYEEQCKTECGANIVEYALDLIKRQKAEIERLEVENSTTHKLLKDAWERIEEFDNLNGKQKEDIERLQSMNQAKLDTIHDLMAEIERLQKEAEKWKNAMMAECMLSNCNREDEIKSEAIKEFAEKVDEVFLRYGHLHSHADCARKDYIKADDGTEIEMQSVWDVFTLKKYEIAEYEEMSSLQKNIETIANERLLTELEKDFKLLVKELTHEPTKIEHNSLCETETYESR